MKKDKWPHAPVNAINLRIFFFWSLMSVFLEKNLGNETMRRRLSELRGQQARLSIQTKAKNKTYPSRKQKKYICHFFQQFSCCRILVEIKEIYHSNTELTNFFWLNGLKPNQFASFGEDINFCCTSVSAWKMSVKQVWEEALHKKWAPGPQLGRGQGKKQKGQEMWSSRSTAFSRNVLLSNLQI